MYKERKYLNISLNFIIITVDAPIINATTSVIEVTVIETPACFSINPIRWGNSYFSLLLL